MFKRTRVCSGVMLAFGSGLVVGAAPAFAQDAPQRIEITGSAIKRIDAETSLPVTVMTREEIARTGVTNMEQLVMTISAAQTTGNTTGSQMAGLSTYGLSSISLRGLGEQRTLVLVNGRRLAVFAGGGSGGAVDVNAIPLAAIDRVEVLRDGASATYGSDAVAGVVNFILRKDYTGFEATVNAGTPTKSGGGQVYRGNLLWGASGDRFNVMLGVDLEKSRALFAKDRDFAASGNRVPYFQNAATPSGRIEGIYDPTKSSAANARNATTNPYGISSSGYGNPFAPDHCADINMFAVQGKGGVGGAYNNCNFDSAPYVSLFPKIERRSLVGSGKFTLSPQAELYGEFMYAHTQSTEAYQPSPLRNGFLATDALFGSASTVQSVPPVLLVYPTNPAYQSVFKPYALANGLSAMVNSGLPVAVTLRTFLTGPRTDQVTNTQSRFVGGSRGTVADWDYDVGLIYNIAKTGGSVTDGYFSQYQLATVLDNPASTWNPWAPGGAQDATTNAALQAAKYIGPTISGKSTAYGIDATGSRTLFNLNGGAMQLAVGGTARKENYQIIVPDILGSGDIAGLGGATLPVDTSRTASALFAELNAPVLKNLELNGSVRTDHYSDVGTTTNGKVSVKYTPVTGVLLRAAAGTGFRAPTLYELHQPSSVGTSEQFIDPAFPADGEVQANAINGGNAALKPEKSKQMSLGIVLSPVRSVTLGADFFLIDISNYIIKPSALALVTNVRAGHPLFGPNDATFAPDGTVDTVDQTLRNAASALLRGVDVDANWTDTFGFGRLQAELNGTYMQTFDLKTLAGVQHSVGTIIQPDGSPLDVAGLGVVARWRHRAAFTWSNSSFAVTVAQNFMKGYQDANDLNGDPHFVPSVTTYDSQVAYTGYKGLRLVLGLRNMFDKKPPIFIGNGESFQYGYDPQNYDPRGRFVYMTASYKFF